MHDPVHRLHNRVHRRKLVAELGRLSAQAACLRAGLRECLTECVRISERTDPIATTPILDRSDGEELIDALRDELPERYRWRDREDAPAVSDLLARARDQLVRAARVARRAFTRGLLCDHARNLLYRPGSRRAEDPDLAIDDVSGLADELALSEQHVSVLLFAIRSGRSYGDARRLIHPRAVGPAEDAAADAS